MNYKINEDGLFVPESLTWHGGLDLSRTDVVALPEGLNVRGGLSLLHCRNIGSLPDRLRVGGHLYLDGCTKLLPTLPEIFQIDERWYTKDFPWPIRRFGAFLEIGCQGHRVESWLSFSDTDIGDMDRRALEFWRKYKKLLIEVGLLEETS